MSITRKSRLSSAEISAATLTGRSGINLDVHGYRRMDNQIVMWVLDGVSPIIFRSSETWRFRDFHTAGKVLNQVFLQTDWEDLPLTLNQIATRVRQSEFGAVFIANPFFLRPLYSIGLVSLKLLNHRELLLEMVLYGDCVIIIKDIKGTRILEYAGLERLKRNLDRVFQIGKMLPSNANSCMRKMVFSAIRATQIWFGAYRVYSVGKEFGPRIHVKQRLVGSTDVWIMSDGASWFFRNNPAKLDYFSDLDSKEGPMRVLDTVKENESSNSGFGANDDATVMMVKV